MTEAQPFIDYYDALQVSPNCDAKMLEAAYHYLAKLYHPDHTGSTDATSFSAVNEAFRVLRNPEQRAEYDQLYAQYHQVSSTKYSATDVAGIEEQSAIEDADAHARILTFLYKRRREDAQNAGVVGYYLQELLGCCDEHFEFHKWYLKEKGFIVLTEQGTMAITIQGIDHVISMSRTSSAVKLLLAQSDDQG